MFLRMVAVSLFSAALLVIELGLTRLFATRYYPPLVFLILSCAILGLGLGAAGATWQPQWRQGRFLPIYVAGVSVSTLVSSIATLYDGHIALLLPLALLPFVFAGLLLATLFSLHSEASPHLYFADLCGAGSGILLVTPLAQWVGLPVSLAVALALLIPVGLLFDTSNAVKLHKSQARAVLVVLIATAGVALSGALWYPPSATALFAGKPIAARLEIGGKIVATDWDLFARTDLIDPGGGRPYELYLDGAAGSIMPPAAGHPFLLRDIGFFPFATEQPERVFVIGPGGGLELWFGLQSGVKEIVAVEVNPASVEFIQEFGTYNGHLAEQQGVRLLVGEGRNVLTNEGRHYDLIVLSQVVTLAAERSGYALVENRVYTVEAFTTYLSHLRPNGIVAFKLYDQPTLTRALATVVQVLGNDGLSTEEALTRVIILLDPQHDPAIPLLMVRNEPFTREDVLSIGAVANTVGFQPYFLPGLWAESPLAAIASGDETLERVVQNAAMNVTPTTDAQPFFFSFERGIPTQLQPLCWGIVLLFVFGLVALSRMASAPAPGKRYGFAGYFAAIGIGFMVIEITVVQQTQRLLGHPTMTLTVVLATLLIGAGIGSWFSGYWLSRRDLPVRRSTVVDTGVVDREAADTPSSTGAELPHWPFLGILLLWAAWTVIWPQLADQFLSASLLWRMSAVVAYLLPLALLMGMPFALGLRAAACDGATQVALAWTVNGIASVVGTICALLIALFYSYHLVALFGWICYLAALLFSRILSTNQP